MQWDYPHAPPMRPIGDPVRDPDWMFIFDQLHVVSRPKANPTSPAAVRPASAPVRSAIR